MEDAARSGPARATAVFSVSGPIGWLHYTGGPFSGFDLFQHLNIFMDGTAGIVLLGLAVWIARSRAGETA